MVGQSALRLSLQRLRHLCLRMGWPAALGLALVLAAVFTETVAIAELEQQLAGIRKQRTVLRTEMARANNAEAAPTLQLEALREREKIDQLLADMHAAARDNQVRLEQGEYRLQAESGTRLARYRMIIPARASYVQLRQWLDVMSASQPGLQIDDLAFKRENIGQDSVEARISFSLLVRVS